MKLVVKREPFLTALSAASAVVPLRHVRPILKHALLLPSTGKALEIQATDMEVGLRYRIKAEAIEEASSLCLPCATLAGLLKECSEDVVTLDTEGAKGVLKVGRDCFEILGHESSEFPEIPSMGKEKGLQIPGVEFGRMIDRTLFAAAREQGRYAINGLFLVFKEKQLEVVATDGRRLAYCKKKLKGEGDLAEGVIVPVKMMQLVRRLCEQIQEKETLEIGISGRSVVIRGGDVTLSSLLVEGIFPKYQQVIPKDMDREVSFNRENMLQALRKAVYLTSEETRTVNLTFTSGTCLIEARSPEKGMASVTVEVDYKGEKICIVFNPQYLQDCLKAITAETVRLELKDPSRPGVIREGKDFQYVLMPVTQRD